MFKSKSKKGALELSMNTIVIIVIGVTLLILGLAFVRGVFQKVGGISDDTFRKSKTLLEGVDNINQFLTINPGELEVNQGADDVVKIIILNREEKTITVQAKSSNGGDDKLSCLFIDEDTKNGKSTSKSYNIASGSQEKLALIVKDLNGNLRTTGCNVEVLGAPTTEDNSESIIVRVTQAK